MVCFYCYIRAAGNGRSEWWRIFAESVARRKLWINESTVSLDALVDNVGDFTELSEPDCVTVLREIKNNGVLVFGQ